MREPAVPERAIARSHACGHSPAELACQSASIEEFLLAVVGMEQGGTRSPVDVVHEDVVHRLWRENPDLLSPGAATASGDPELVAFAGTLPAPQEVVHERSSRSRAWGSS